MAGLVITAGGSKGAWAAGLVCSLVDKGHDWDVYSGTSTGALITPLVAAGDLDNLYNNYTNITPEDIFSHNPFRVISSNDGHFDYRINHIGIIKNFISGNFKTLGNSENLKKLIHKVFTEDHFRKIRDRKKTCIIGVTNVTMNRAEFKTSDEFEYENFCEWMWISSCAPPFMSLVSKNGHEYADGGLTCPVPIFPVIKRKQETIDTIVLTPENDKVVRTPVRNVLHYLQMTGNTMLYENMRSELDAGHIRGQLEKGDRLTLRLWRTNTELTNNPFIFDPELMRKWWTMGNNENTYQQQKFTYKKTGKKEVLTLDI